MLLRLVFLEAVQAFSVINCSILGIRGDWRLMHKTHRMFCFACSIYQNLCGGLSICRSCIMASDFS
jgi:hypothetical protein